MAYVIFSTTKEDMSFYRVVTAKLTQTEADKEAKRLAIEQPNKCFVVCERLYSITAEVTLLKDGKEEK